MIDVKVFEFINKELVKSKTVNLKNSGQMYKFGREAFISDGFEFNHGRECLLSYRRRVEDRIEDRRVEDRRNVPLFSSSLLSHQAFIVAYDNGGVIESNLRSCYTIPKYIKEHIFNKEVKNETFKEKYERDAALLSSGDTRVSAFWGKRLDSLHTFRNRSKIKELHVATGETYYMYTRDSNYLNHFICEWSNR